MRKYVTKREGRRERGREREREKERERNRGREEEKGNSYLCSHAADRSIVSH